MKTRIVISHNLVDIFDAVITNDKLTLEDLEYYANKSLSNIMNLHDIVGEDGMSVAIVHNNIVNNYKVAWHYEYKYYIVKL